MVYDLAALRSHDKSMETETKFASVAPNKRASIGRFAIPHPAARLSVPREVANPDGVFFAVWSTDEKRHVPILGVDNGEATAIERYLEIGWH